MADPFFGEMPAIVYQRVQQDLQHAGLTPLGARQALRGDVITSKQDRLKLSQLLTSASSGIHRSLPEDARKYR